MIDRAAASRPARSASRLRRRIGRAWQRRGASRRLIADRAELPGILAVLSAIRPDAQTWVVHGSHAAEPAILIVGPEGAASASVIRIAHSAVARQGLVKAAAAVEALRQRLSDGRVTALLPAPISQGDLGDRHWLAETALPGVSARSMLSDPAARARMLVAATAAIAMIHEETGARIVVDDARLAAWVHQRTRRIADALPRGRPSDADLVGLATIESAVAIGLRGRSLTAGWVHGDLWPANILVEPVGGSVTGLVDWDSADAGELALHDRLHLALTTRRLVAHEELGRVLVALLRGAAWTDDDRIVLGADLDLGSGQGSGPARPLPADEAFTGLGIQIALWLYWLRFVDTNLLRHPELATDRDWLATNVREVLRCA